MSQIKGASHYGQTTKAPFSEWRWTRNQGESESVFEVGTADYLRNVRAPELMLDYDSITIRPDNGGGDMFRLDAARTGQEWQDLHEVQGSNLTQSVLINRVMKAKFLAAGIPEGKYIQLVSDIAQKVAQRRGTEQAYTQMYDQVIQLYDAVVNGEINQAGIDVCGLLLNHLDLNTDHYLAEQYVYRHSWVIPDRSYDGDLGYIYNNTHRVFTESQLRSDENIPGFYSLPASTINNNGALWLKQPVSDCLDGVSLRRSITIEFLAADDWSALLYKNKE